MNNQIKIENNQELEIFKKLFKKNINKNKKLEPKYFKRLSKIIKEGQVVNFLKLFTEFTNNEAIVIGRALLKNKIENVNEIINFLVLEKNKYFVIILTFLLCKGKIIENLGKITEFIKNFFDQELNLNFYKLILVVCRKYKSAIDREILDFCSQKKHPVLEEVIKEYNKI